MLQDATCTAHLQAIQKTYNLNQNFTILELKIYVTPNKFYY